jgi:hypothetical protein
MSFVLIAGNLEKSALSSIQPNFVMPVMLTAEGLSSFLNNILKKGEVNTSPFYFLEFFCGKFILPGNYFCQNIKRDF